jgi:hypothetical protein
MTHEIGGDALAGERRQNPDVRDSGVADDGSAGQGEPARHGIGGANELVFDECADGSAPFQQCGDLPRGQTRQGRKADHRGAEQIRRGNQVAFAVEHTDLGGHTVIMSRNVRVSEGASLDRARSRYTDQYGRC